MLLDIILLAAGSLFWGFLGYQVCELISAIAARRAQLRRGQK